jgi:GT2 family glycosyltransferase
MRQKMQSFTVLPVGFERHVMIAHEGILPPMTTMPDVTVSLVGGADNQLLLTCLDTVAAAAGSVTVQVVVVDNASPDGLASTVGRVHPEVELIVNEQRRGFGANHNAVLKRARGRHVFILNDDTELHEGCIERLCRFMDQNPTVGAAGPRILRPGGSVQPSAFHLPTPARVALTALTLQRAGWIQSGTDRIRSVGWVTGAAIMARRDALLGVAGFDERFFMYCEDADLCRQLRDGGWEVAFFPQASLMHLENATTSAVPVRRIYQTARSRGMYTRKHHGPAAERLVQGLTAGMFAARAGLAQVLPGYSADDVATFRETARAALHPHARDAVEDVAAAPGRAAPV